VTVSTIALGVLLCYVFSVRALSSHECAVECALAILVVAATSILLFGYVMDTVLQTPK